MTKYFRLLAFRNKEATPHNRAHLAELGIKPDPRNSHRSAKWSPAVRELPLKHSTPFTSLSSLIILLIFTRIGVLMAEVNYDRIKSLGIFQNSGANPYGGVIEATDGNLYGTVYFGGTNDGGAVFRIKKDGTD